MKNIWSWIGIVILIALLGWAGYYGWQQRGTLENLRNELGTLRSELANESNSLQNQIGSNLSNLDFSVNPVSNGIGSNNTDQSEPKDERTLITVNAQGFYDVSGDAPGPGCSTDFNTGSATTTSVYINTAKGLSVSLPYNPKWGSSEYRINPYDIGYAGGVIFGWIAPFEGCTVVREYHMSFLPAKSASQLMLDLPKESDLNHDISTKILNGLEMVEYTGEGLCSYPTVIVIGQKYNYEFGATCSDNFTELENIAKTVKLL